MKISLEHAYHYRCDRCDKWWTICDTQPSIGAISYCPHCGHKNIVERIQSHELEVFNLPKSSPVNNEAAFNNDPPSAPTNNQYKGEADSKLSPGTGERTVAASLFKESSSSVLGDK